MIQKHNPYSYDQIIIFRYLITDFIIAAVFEYFQIERIKYLKYSQNYYLNFLNNCIKYELIKIEDVEYSEIKRYFIEDKDSDDVKEERFELWLKNVPRDSKIDRMKRILRLKNNNKEILEKLNIDTGIGNNNVIVDEIEEDEEENYQFWIDWINCCFLMTLDRLGLLLREIELLEMGEDGEKERKQPPVENSINDKLTTIEKPFKLVKDRKQIAADAFKYGHNLPTMTIDEYLNLEKKRGNIITGGGAASAVNKDIDEDDEVAMHIELMKAREFDEFKDSKTKYEI